MILSEIHVQLWTIRLKLDSLFKSLFRFFVWRSGQDINGMIELRERFLRRSVFREFFFSSLCCCDARRQEGAKGIRIGIFLLRVKLRLDKHILRENEIGRLLVWIQ